MEKKQENPAIERLNRLAEECYALRQAGNISEFDNKLALLFDLYLKVMKKTVEKTQKNEELLINLFAYQWGYKGRQIEQKDGWTPERPFYQTSKSLLNKRLKNKQKEWEQLDDGTDTIDEEGNRRNVQRQDPRPTPDQLAEVQNTVVFIFDLLNDMVQCSITSSPNKFCYPQRFYTELVAKMIQRHAVSVGEIPARTEYNIDIAFADSFLEEQIVSLPDFAGATLKSLRCFTGKEADEQTPCGYDLRTVVYQAYVEKVTAKRPNDSAISQQRSKFKNLLQQVRAQI